MLYGREQSAAKKKCTLVHGIVQKSATAISLILAASSERITGITKSEVTIILKVWYYLITWLASLLLYYVCVFFVFSLFLILSLHSFIFALYYQNHFTGLSFSLAIVCYNTGFLKLKKEPNWISKTRSYIHTCKEI